MDFKKRGWDTDVWSGTVGLSELWGRGEACPVEGGAAGGEEYSFGGFGRNGCVRGGGEERG